MSAFSDWFKAKFGIGTTPIPTPTPDPVPEPDPTPGQEPEVPPTPVDTGTVVTLRKRTIPGVWLNSTITMLYGSSPVNVKALASNGVWLEAVFLVVSGQLTITDWGVGGYFKPSIVLKKDTLFGKRQVKRGDVIATGKKLYVYLVIGDRLAGVYGRWANYAAHTKELGQIVESSAQLNPGN